MVARPFRFSLMRSTLGNIFVCLTCYGDRSVKKHVERRSTAYFVSLRLLRLLRTNETTLSLSSYILYYCIPSPSSTWFIVDSFLFRDRVSQLQRSSRHWSSRYRNRKRYLNIPRKRAFAIAIALLITLTISVLRAVRAFVTFAPIGGDARGERT